MWKLRRWWGDGSGGKKFAVVLDVSGLLAILALALAFIATAYDEGFKEGRRRGYEAGHLSGWSSGWNERNQLQRMWKGLDQ